MTEPDKSPLDDDAFIDAFLDTLIPPGERMPGAGSIGIGAQIRAQVAGNRALAKPVVAALSALRDAALERDPGGLAALDGATREAVLGALMPQQPVLGMFQMFVFAAYYQHPKALEGLGLPGRPPFPGGHEIVPTDPALLEKLRARAKS